MFGQLDRPVYFILPILYSIAGLGIAIVNDFKSVEGDRQLGLNSLPVAFGIDGAKWICAGSVTLTQLGVAGYYKASANQHTQQSCSDYYCHKSISRPLCFCQIQLPMM